MIDSSKILDNIKQNVLSIHYPYIKPYVRINKYLDLDYQWDSNEALILLNKCLFQHYFGVVYNFPVDATFLVPRLPIRLKYLCWIEKIMKAQREKGLREKSCYDQVTGLDIGTGANLVQPLIGKSIFDWNFLATEINKESYIQAEKILNQNQEYVNSIELRKVDKGILKDNIEKNDEKIDFLCCNPPFYSNKEQKELIEKTNFVGHDSEIYYKHGEIGFMYDQINDSVEYIEKIGQYTCFIQKIDSVHQIQQKVKSLEKKYTNLKVHFWIHEEPLGRISRYFLGWCYELIDLITNEKFQLQENPDFIEKLQQKSLNNSPEVSDNEDLQSEELEYGATKKLKIM